MTPGSGHPTIEVTGNGLVTGVVAQRVKLVGSSTGSTRGSRLCSPKTRAPTHQGPLGRTFRYSRRGPSAREETTLPRWNSWIAQRYRAAYEDLLRRDLDKPRPVPLEEQLGLFGTEGDSGQRGAIRAGQLRRNSLGDQFTRNPLKPIDLMGNCAYRHPCSSRSAREMRVQ